MNDYCKLASGRPDPQESDREILMKEKDYLYDQAIERERKQQTSESISRQVMTQH
jgi:ornithine cyclodeaminase/alanine dehydrogenase-like protein (mu-crystallin family)